MEDYGIIYLWYDRKRKMYYIGCHWGTENDGYICSSRRMRDAYRRRPQDFKRRILSRIYTTRQDLLEEEYKWLQLIRQEEIGKKYYNLKIHKWDHWSADENSRKTIKQRLSEASKRLHQDPEYKQKFLEGRKNLPHPTKEQIEKRAKSNTGKKRSKESLEKMRKSFLRGKNHPMYGKTLSEKTKQKIREKLTGDKNPFYGKTHSEETKKIMSEKISNALKGTPCKNREFLKTSFWWNNGKTNTRCKNCPGDNWLRGRI